MQHPGEAPTGDRSAAWVKGNGKDKQTSTSVFSLSMNASSTSQECETAFAMWTIISDFFQRRTLLNHLAARSRFYSVQMKESDSTSTIAYIYHVRQLAADQSIDSKVTAQEPEITVLSVSRVSITVMFLIHRMRNWTSPHDTVLMIDVRDC